MTSSRAAQHKTDQTKLARLLALEVAPLIVPQPGRSAVKALIDTLVALVAQYHRASAYLAAEFYETEREQAGIRQLFTTPLADPDTDQLVHSLGWATRDLADRAVDLDAVLSRTEGSSGRLALAGGRDTLVGAAEQDSACTGWVRVARRNACPFCAVMATRLQSTTGRGGAYRSRQTAGFSAHDHCGCVPRPVFAGQDYQPEPYVQEWADLYREHASGSSNPMAAFRAALEQTRT